MDFLNRFKTNRFKTTGQDFLERFKITKQKALSSHRPGYPVPQYMSDSDATRLKGARDDLERAYHEELAKPESQRNYDLLWEMDNQLYPRLGRW